MSPIRDFRTPLARALSASLLSLAFVSAPVMAQPSTPGLITMSLDQQTALGVRLAAVQSAAAAQIDLPARVAVPPSQQAVVAAPAAGLVTRLLANPGDLVKSGQPLAELSSPQIAQSVTCASQPGTGPPKPAKARRRLPGSSAWDQPSAVQPERSSTATMLRRPWASG